MTGVVISCQLLHPALWNSLQPAALKNIMQWAYSLDKTTLGPSRSVYTVAVTNSFDFIPAVGLFVQTIGATVGCLLCFYTAFFQPS